MQAGQPVGRDIPNYTPDDELLVMRGHLDLKDQGFAHGSERSVVSEATPGETHTDEMWRQDASRPFTTDRVSSYLHGTLVGTGSVQIPETGGPFEQMQSMGEGTELLGHYTFHGPAPPSTYYSEERFSNSQIGAEPRALPQSDFFGNTHACSLEEAQSHVASGHQPTSHDVQTTFGGYGSENLFSTASFTDPSCDISSLLTAEDIEMLMPYQMQHSASSENNTATSTPFPDEPPVLQNSSIADWSFFMRQAGFPSMSPGMDWENAPNFA